MTAAKSKTNKRKTKNNTSAQQMNVAVVTHFFGAHGGGIELVAERLISEITRNKDIQFTWVSSDADPAPLIEGQKMLPMYSVNILEKTIGVPWPIWGWKSLKTLKNTIKKADVVWLHDTLYLGNILAYKWARKFDKPIIITQHIAPISYRNVLLRKVMKIADKLFSERMLKKANEVTFISDRVAEDYYRRIVFTRPIKVIPNGVDTRLFHLPLAENRRFLRQQFALKNDQPVFLFVGRFVDRKGLKIIRILAEKLPHIRFWLAGRGPIDPDEWLLPNVHVFRNRKGQTLADLYHAADMFILPSHGEGFPLVIQEAIACGLPVLCSAETAQGSALAQPHLQIADVWPDNPERTATTWIRKLKKLPISLPLSAPSEEKAEFAFSTWNWQPIADVYADILKKLHKENQNKDGRK